MVGFPLLLIPLAIYNIIVFLMPGVSFTDPLVKLTLMSGAEWTVTLSDVLLDARHPAAARRSHQGRAPRREISHRPSAVADRVRRGGGRIRAVAEIRHLDLFPADGTVAGGFPLRPCLANAAPCRCGGARRLRLRQKRAEKVEAPAAEPQSTLRRQRHLRLLRHRYRRQPLSPNPCCRITPNRNRCSPPSRPRRLRSCPRRPRRKRLPRKPRHRRSRRRECSRAAARSRSPPSPDKPQH